MLPSNANCISMNFCYFFVFVAILVPLLEASVITGAKAYSLVETGQIKEGIEAFEKLAAQGDDLAMVQLGIYYYEGQSIKQDYGKAMDWWLKAYAKDNADAFVNLGVMHRDGLGVPKNKKVAYCVFLTTHMCGLGNESTQYRANSCLRRIMPEMTIDEVKGCLSNYSYEYIKAYLLSRGKMEEVPDEHKPSKDNPAFKDTGWFLDGELDAVFGPPTEEVKKARAERDRRRGEEIERVEHELVFQFKFTQGEANEFRAYEFITDGSASSKPIDVKKLQDGTIFDGDELIFKESHRYLTLVSTKGGALVYKISLDPVASPVDWSEWKKADFALNDNMSSYQLMRGQEPIEKETAKDGPMFRFKVVK